jgi:hypothetical protein
MHDSGLVDMLEGCDRVPSAFAAEPTESDPDYDCDENGNSLWRCEIRCDGGHSVVGEVWGKSERQAKARAEWVASVLRAQEPQEVVAWDYNWRERGSNREWNIGFSEDEPQNNRSTIEVKNIRPLYATPATAQPADGLVDMLEDREYEGECVITVHEANDIIQALRQQPASEVVAWAYEDLQHGDSVQKSRPWAGNKAIRNIRPLYASPPPDSALVDALIEEAVSGIMAYARGEDYDPDIAGEIMRENMEATLKAKGEPLAHETKENG